MKYGLSLYQDKNWAKPFVKEAGKWRQLKDAFLSVNVTISIVSR